MVGKNKTTGKNRTGKLVGEDPETHVKKEGGTLHQPAFQTGDKAIVLGAREGNIGGAIAEKLCGHGWIAQEDDCYRPDEGHQHKDFRYQAPEPEELAPFDACVITLGTTHMEPFIEVKGRDLKKVLRGSLELPLECARRYVQARADKLLRGTIMTGPKEIIQHHSTIIFIGSYANDHPFTHCTSYCVAKAGLDMAVQSLAWELMPDGFDVHIIHPHHVGGTPMTEEVLQGMQKGVHHMTREQALEYQHKDLRMSRLLDPEDIAEMVYVMLTEPVMRWISGQGTRMYGGVR